jgi:hypothetical protein
MALQIANPVVVAKVERLAKATGLTKTAVVEIRMVVHGRRGQRGVIVVDDVPRLAVFETVAPGPAEMEAAHAASPHMPVPVLSFPALAPRSHAM